ncbi:uncharacterized protein BDV14DRAFT_195460 [Aspergillus stella-maris]|uniref:uncharacterized protein n=1 Tax=Aspergillus stella-maris TaxID=1810926 RepID=UPI003CCCD8FF
MAAHEGLPPTFASLLRLVADIAQLSYTCARLIKNGPRAQYQYLQEIFHLLKHLLSLEQGAELADWDLSPPSSPNSPPTLDEETTSACYDGLFSLYANLKGRMKGSPVIHPLHERGWKGYLEGISKCRSLLEMQPHSDYYMRNASLKGEQLRKLLLTWLPGPDASLRRPSPSPGTGDWFLEKDVIQRWI